ncbi:hypothetical protein DMJ13_24520 [halophilic archaeon]|nr:hypothetical protein DMJ13_24520 [halophilic archaeon]
MEVPRSLETMAGLEEAVTTTHRDYEEGGVIAVDFGPAAGEPAVDVVGETAIVVLDDDQFEFEIPSTASVVDVNNGVLTLAE